MKTTPRLRSAELPDGSPVKSLRRSWNILFQHLSKASRSLLILLLFLIATPNLQAIHDTNHNGVSDLWEKKYYNGQLALNFDPAADPDGDGWTNSQEASAGTDPSSGTSLTGHVRPKITRLPGIITISWPTVMGKKYRLFSSSDLTLGAWTQVVEPETGYGTEITKNLNLTLPDGTTPQRNFWRVTVTDQDSDSDTLTDTEEAELGSSSYSSDGDNDGLSDLAELFTYGTNPRSRDSDADGISDSDEILVNFTSPTNSSDTDGDYIPDDFERHLARQLLAYRSNSTAWGAYYAGLLTGNLDATHDYTGDGMTALQLYQTLKNIPAAGLSRSGFLVEQQYRWNYLGSDYFASPDFNWRSRGEYRYNIGNSISPYDTFFPTAVLTPEYLQSRIDAISWGQFSITPADAEFFYQAYLGSKFVIKPVTQIIDGLPAYSYVQSTGSIGQERLRLIATDVGHKKDSRTYLKAAGNSPDYPYIGYDERILKTFQTLELQTIQIPQGRIMSDWSEFKAPAADGLQIQNSWLWIIPMEQAPMVLPVNSDFDEGRIDPTTGYAIPDCDDMPGVDLETGSGNNKLELNAVRNHLDGKFTQGELVVKDLHQGWFGMLPVYRLRLDLAGANITIRKVDQIDPDTGYKESGQVRFYAKWAGAYFGISPYDFNTLEPVNLMTGGINGRPGEGVYAANSPIPYEAKFYMEGVRPGKITLEWRLQRGDIDVKFEQTFNVETQKSVAEWQEEVRYQIRLQTKVKTGNEVDVSLYHPGDGFRNENASLDNVLRINAMYDYYQQLFKQMPEKFMWAGMAKVAAAPIYAGMSDLNTWWQATGVTPPWPPYQGPGDRDYGVEVFIEGLLLDGQKKIFTDMAWAHRAYQASGIDALNNIDDSEINKSTDYNSWRSLDSGIHSNNQTMIFAANGNLLRREQQELVQQNYDIVQNLKMRQPPARPSINGGVMVATDINGLANAGEWLSANSNNNPLPGGPSFRATFPGARLDFFNDRWAWTSNAASGMLQIWTGTSTSSPGFNAGRRNSENGKTIKAAASAYSYDPSGLP